MKPSAVAVLVAALAAASAAKAEIEDPWREIMLKGRDMAADLVSAADASMARGDFGKAVPAYQRVLAEFPDSFVPAAPDRMVSAAERVRDRIASFPPEARKLYEELYSSAARSRKEEALRTGDPAALAAVARLYPAAEGGLEAASEAARACFRNGEHARAARLYEHLFRFAGADLARWAADAAIWSAALAKTGKAPPSGGIWLKLASGPGGLKVSHKGRQEALGSVMRKAAAKQKCVVPGIRASDWKAYGGSGSGDRAAEGDVLSLTRQAGRVLPAIPMLQERFRYGDSVFMNDDYLRRIFRPVQPVVSGGIVYVHTGIEFLALNMLKDLDLVWKYSSPHPASAFASEKFEPNAVYASTLHEGILYASMAVPYDSTEVRSKIWGGSITVIQDIPYRKLVALDAATGECLWTAGGRQHAVSQIDQLSFFGAPAADGRSIYAAGRLQTGSVSHYVAKLDALTGRPEWIAHVCTGQNELNMFGRMVRESFGSTVAIRDGSLYYCSNLGVVACIDADSGIRRWVVRYETVESQLFQDMVTRKLPPQWYSNPLAATEGVLIATPTDSPWFYAFDRHTGEVLWKKRNGARSAGENFAPGLFYFLGVCDGKAVVSGRVVKAWSVADGKEAWSVDLSGVGGQEFSLGRGTVSQGLVYVPTNLGMWILDGRKGTRVAGQPWQRSDSPEGGNLVLADGVLVSAGQRAVGTFFDIERIYRSVLDRIAAEPANPNLHLRAAAICVGSKTPRYPDAVRHLLEARRISGRRQPVEAEVKKGLFGCYMKEATERWKTSQIGQAAELFQKALEEAPDSESAVGAHLWIIGLNEKKSNAKGVEAALETLIRDYGALEYDFFQTENTRTGELTPVGLWARFALAEHMEKQKKPRQAVAIYQEIIAEFRGSKYRRSLSDQTAEADAAAAARIRYIVARAGSTVYEEFNKRAADLFQKGVAERDAALLKKVSELYPNSDSCPRSVVALAGLLLAQGRSAEALVVLKSFRESNPASPFTPQVLHTLVLAYEAENLLSVSKRILRQIEADWAQARITTEEGPAFAGVWASERLKEERYRGVAALHVPADVRMPVERAWTRPIPPRNPQVILRPYGPRPESAKDMVFLLGPRVVECVSATDARKVWEWQLESDLGAAPSAVLLGSKVAGIVTERGIAGLDLSSGIRKWKKVFPPAARVKGASVSGDIVAMNVAMDFETSAVVVLDAESGRELFTSPNLKGKFTDGAPLHGAAGVVSYTWSQQAEVLVLNADSGSLLFEKRVPLGFQSPPALLADSGIVYVSGDRLVVLNDRDGSTLWEYPIERARPGTMRTDGSRIAEISCPGERAPFATTGLLLMLNPAGRLLKWRATLDRSLGYEIDSFSPDHVYLVERNFSGADSSTSLCAYALEDGALSWKIYLMATDSAKVSVVGGKETGLVQAFARDGAGRYKGQYYLFDRRTGLIKKQIPIDSQLRFTPTFDVADGRLVLVGDGVVECWGK